MIIKIIIQKMENLLIEIFEAIDMNLSFKLKRLEEKISKNRKDFDYICVKNSKIQKDILNLYRQGNEKFSALDEIGLMFRMVQSNPNINDLENFNISKIVSKYKV
jgi:hypothetical protein